ELFIKNVDALFTSTMSRTYPEIVEKTFQEESFFIHRRFLPFGRTDLTASSSLLLTRGSSLQLHEPLPPP
ncbi:MAG: hypothetical protein WBF32_01115, partial [Candidatus Aminicenantaceae bacterium]